MFFFCSLQISAQRKNSQENNNERPRASSGSKNTSNISSQPSAGQNGPQNAPQQQQQQLEKSIKIKDGDTGYSYTTVFSSYLNNSVKVLIEDPYIRHKHQVGSIFFFIVIEVLYFLKILINTFFLFDVNCFWLLLAC